MIWLHTFVAKFRIFVAPFRIFVAKFRIFVAKFRIFVAPFRTFVAKRKCGSIKEIEPREMRFSLRCGKTAGGRLREGCGRLAGTDSGLRENLEGLPNFRFR